MKTTVVWIIPPSLLIVLFWVIGSALSESPSHSYKASHVAYEDLPEYNRSPRTLLENGKSAMRSGEYLMAREYCEIGIKSEDKEIKQSSLLCLAYSYKGMEAYKESIEVFRTLQEFEEEQSLDTKYSKQQIAELEAKL